jgi:putative nucleotidyltransferase with HDIG domain
MEQLYSVSTDFILLLNQYHVLNIHKLEEVRKESVLNRQRAYWLLSANGIVLGLFILVFGLRLSRSFIHPIRMLEAGTERVAAGDWDYRVDIRTGDELEALARRFNGMAEKLGKLYRSLEEQVAERTHQITERLEDLATLLESSTELSATLDMDRLLPQIAERLARTIKTTYCRIALFEEDHPHPVIRAAYPIRMLDWEPGVGRILECQKYPALCEVLKPLRYVVLNNETIQRPEWAAERADLLTPNTHSALILPLVWENRLKGWIILGEYRHWKREPFSEEKISLGQTLVNQAVVAITNAHHYVSLHEMFLATVSAMTSAIDAKSHWTRGHSDRVTRYAVALGERVGLDDSTLNDLRLGCLLHDIGKIGTIEAILDKPDRLTPEESAIMKLHPAKGEEILKPIRYFKAILPVIRHHHEQYDGTGYPDGLAGDAISLLARITAIADTYDSMTADRPYRPAPGREKAMAEIRRCSGTQFDPSLAKVFVSMLEQGYQ